MKISVVISTYNGEKYILNQLKSINEQTRKADEVIISDDCSSDSTVDIVEMFIEKNKLNNWIVIKNKINKGWRKNFFDLMTLASGDIIFTCDQDDIWYKFKLEKMTKEMQNNAGIGVLASDYDTFSETRIKKRKKRNSYKVKKIQPKYNFMNVSFPGCVYCIRKSFFLSIKPYWKDNFPHDGFLWRFSMLSDQLYYFDCSTIMQRKHENSSYTKESKLSRNYETKLNGISYVEDTINALQKYIQDKSLSSKAVYNILDDAKKWNNGRKKFYDSKKYRDWFFLIKYIRSYSTIKKYILDLFVVTKYRKEKCDESNGALT